MRLVRDFSIFRRTAGDRFENGIVVGEVTNVPLLPDQILSLTMKDAVRIENQSSDVFANGCRGVDSGEIAAASAKNAIADEEIAIGED